MMTKLEALADSIAKINGWHDPQSKAYKLRNPGMLKNFSPKNEQDEDGNRVFRSFPSGYDNLVIDLKIKCSGQSRAKLTPDSTLSDLVLCYQQPQTAVHYVVNFLKHALQLHVTEHTKLSFFVE